MEKYKLLCNIGQGSFGVISKVQRAEDGKVRLRFGIRRALVANTPDSTGVCAQTTRLFEDDGEGSPSDIGGSVSPAASKLRTAPRPPKLVPVKLMSADSSAVLY